MGKMNQDKRSALFSTFIFILIGTGLSFVQWKENRSIDVKFINYVLFLVVWPIFIVAAILVQDALLMGIVCTLAWIWGIVVMACYSGHRMVVEMSIFTNGFLTLYFFLTRYINSLIHPSLKCK